MVKNVVWEEVEGTFDQGDPQWFSTFGNTGLGDTPTCSKTALKKWFSTFGSPNVGLTLVLG